MPRVIRHNHLFRSSIALFASFSDPEKEDLVLPRHYAPSLSTRLRRLPSVDFVDTSLTHRKYAHRAISGGATVKARRLSAPPQSRVARMLSEREAYGGLPLAESLGTRLRREAAHPVARQGKRTRADREGSLLTERADLFD